MKTKSTNIIALLLTLVFVLGGCGKAVKETGSSASEKTPVYSIGEKWKVKNEWEFKVNSVTVHSFCNSTVNNTFEERYKQVVLIDYTYANTGYSFEHTPLLISSSSFSVSDETGSIANGYNCLHTTYPQYCQKGFNCTAQQAFALVNNSSNIMLTVALLNSKGELEKAEFKLDITTSENSIPLENTQNPSTPNTPTDTPSTTPTGCSHNYSSATCTTPKTCTKCGATDGIAKGHNWRDATCDNPKTCQSCGASEGSALGHSISNGICSVCNSVDPLFWQLAKDGYYKLKSALLNPDSLDLRIVNAGLADGEQISAQIAEGTYVLEFFYVAQNKMGGYSSDLTYFWYDSGRLVRFNGHINFEQVAELDVNDIP